LETGWRRDERRFGGTIVGIVGDVRQFTLAAEPLPEIYAPLAQWPLDELSVVVQSRGAPAAILPEARDIVHQLDPALPVYDSHPLTDLVRESLAARRFYMMLLASFAALALVLAAIGIFGVIAYGVHQRRRELGIRIALGAPGQRVARLVLGQGMVLTIVGACIGLAAASLLTRVLEGQLFGVQSRDPVTFVAVPMILIVVALLACVVPVRRALTVDPATAIRAES
jgi:putative ABC transport system permease protein